MWVFPLLGTVVSLVFALLLARQFVRRRRPYQALWAVALLLYAAASLALTIGAVSGWTADAYRVFWLFGAVLTVPYLAAGEAFLLVRREWLRTGSFLVLVFVTAYAINRLRVAVPDESALEVDLPRGVDVFAADGGVLVLARLCSYVGFGVLLAGTLWSAWSMRGDPLLRPRFGGTLAIAIGAARVAAGSAFAATGNLAGFSLMNMLGVGVMFWGFLRTSDPMRRGVRTTPGPPRT
ncbi:MAG: hypothetical protein WEA54_02170 [Actinomycetota bacterium]